MILETIVLLSRALRSTEYGVNELLREIPIFPDHKVPPPIAAIFNVLEDEEVAEGAIAPDDWPALVLDQFASAEDSGEIRGSSSGSFIELPSLGVSVLYATQQADIEIAKQDAMYTLRAVRRTIARWLDNTSVADRCVNEMEVRSVVEVFFELLEAELREGGLVTGSLVANFVVRELNPLGA